MGDIFVLMPNPSSKISKRILTASVDPEVSLAFGFADDVALINRVKQASLGTSLCNATRRIVSTCGNKP